MKKKIFLTTVYFAVLLSLLLTSCQGGISQALYDQVAAQVKEAQAKLDAAQQSLDDLQAQKGAAEKELAAAEATVADLQKQLAALQDQASLVGATPEETAVRIVRNYHETHVYSTYDYFTCGDMASEVWNMLKAQGIGAVIVVGKIDAALTDILQSDHAWVLASVGPGEWLALETTGGIAIKKSENPLYYRGWSFDRPADLKSHNDMVKEYNVRVVFRNQLNSEANAVIALHNASTTPAEADKYKAVYDKLVELRTAQETDLNKIKGDIDSLAKPISY